jgi:hypothetical protein
LQAVPLDQGRITDQRTDPDQAVRKVRDLSASGAQVWTNFRFVPVMKKNDLDLERRSGEALEGRRRRFTASGCVLRREGKSSGRASAPLSALMAAYTVLNAGIRLISRRLDMSRLNPR